MRNVMIMTVLLSHSLWALTLDEAVSEALRTHPVVQERLNNFRATQHDLQIAEAEYYPTLDLRVAGGYNRAGRILNAVNAPYPEFLNYESSLTLTQNLFNGFGTRHKVDYQEARVMAASYNYLEKANDIAFRTVGAYLNVIRSTELLQTAKENVAIDTDLYNKIKTLYDGGMTTKSEMNKVSAALSLAKSNLTVQENNARDTYATFRRYSGHEVDPSTMIKPKLKVMMPESFERAAMIAIDNNPSILVGRYNIKGAQSLMGENKKGYYPKVDLEVNQFLNDTNKHNNGFTIPDDRFQARLVMNYNLYRGGADRATEQKNISTINKEMQIMLESKREAIEGIELSWNAYTMVSKQLKDLHEYRQYAEKTLDLYKEEFNMGRRSILEILSAQNDVIGSRQQIVNADRDALFAQYRILDAMGLMVVAVLGDKNEYMAKVNLGNNKHDVINDLLPVKMDQDNDTIPDNMDLCDNSKAGENLMPYGCTKTKEIDMTIKLHDSLISDSDHDGVIDVKDQCPDTPAGYKVDTKGCPEMVTLHLNFATASYAIPSSATADITRLENFLKTHPDTTIDIIGHTDSVGNDELNQILSANRAKALADVLVKHGIAAERMTTQGKGEASPIASNVSASGRAQNRRTEITLHTKTGVQP